MDNLTLNLNTATDMHYSIRDYFSGTMVITNNGGGTISLTDLKITLSPETTSAAATNDEQGNIQQQSEVLQSSGGTGSSSSESGGASAGLSGIYKDLVVSISAIFSRMQEWWASISSAIFGES